MNRLFTLLISTFIMCGCYAKDKTVTINVIETSDVHGNFFPYNFIERKPGKGSLARVSTFLKKQRATYGNNCLYMDNGDFLQGQPTAYYYNFIDTASTHLAAEILNYLGCQAGTMGNHDVETGHAVYDRWISQCNFPVLGANIIDKTTGNPYLAPYKILERDGVKIAVLGMITPAIPCWLPEVLWTNLDFEDMEECARKWVSVIQKKERPDVILGLFHSGQSGDKLGDYIENASRMVAERVPGFDAVLFGHDHSRTCEKIVNCEGDSVLLINPANNANWVGDVTIKVTKRGKKTLCKTVEGRLVSVNDYAPDEDFLDAFSVQYKTVCDFVGRRIGSIDRTINSQNAFFGPAPFIDLIHSLQMDIAGAEVSFCAPLSTHSRIEQGDIYVSDMFNLYKFENMLYTMELTGQEIKDYLEMSYGLWTDRMLTPDDHIMLLREENNPTDEHGHFKNVSFNFDSAAGILYTVDVTKPIGSKITIESMADGTPFSLDRTYRCAINSYRGNGGGDLLTKGAGIPKNELSKRVVSSTDKDLRYYLMEYVEQHGKLSPRPLNHWRFIPEELAAPALKRDRQILFGGN